MHSVRRRCKKKKKMSAAAEQEMELTSLVSHSVEEGRARYAASAASSASTATSAIRRREGRRPATCATVVLGGAACLASFVVMATVAYLAVDRLGLANFGGDGAGEGVVRPSTSITGDGAAVEVAAAATGAGRDAGGGGATGVFLKSTNDEREYRQIRCDTPVPSCTDRSHTDDRLDDSQRGRGRRGLTIDAHPTTLG